MLLNLHNFLYSIKYCRSWEDKGFPNILAAFKLIKTHEAFTHFGSYKITQIGWPDPKQRTASGNSRYQWISFLFDRAIDLYFRNCENGAITIKEPQIFTTPGFRLLRGTHGIQLGRVMASVPNISALKTLVTNVSIQLVLNAASSSSCRSWNPKTW